MTECSGIDQDHKTSFSDDEKHENKMESSRKRTYSEKSSDSNFSKCFDAGGKKEVSHSEPRVEHKWELRRQRKINPRYASDEFSSIFNSSKWSYSNNLDIGEQNASDSTDKAPARKSSYGNRNDALYHIDSDAGVNRGSNIDKFDSSDGDCKRKRSRVRSSESTQEEKGLMSKRQRLKEENTSAVKEQISYLRNEEYTMEGTEINGKSNKLADLKYQEGKNSPTVQKDPMMTAKIYLENSKLENDKNKKYVSLMSEEGSGLSTIDNNHSCSSAVEQIENALKLPEAATVNNPDFGENPEEKCNLSSHKEQINSLSNVNITYHPTSSISNIHSEGEESVSTANDCIEIRSESGEDLKSSKERNVSPSGSCSSYCPVILPFIIQEDNGNQKQLEKKCNSSLHRNDPSGCSIPFAAENPGNASAQSTNITSYSISSSVENSQSKETSVTEAITDAQCDYLQSKNEKESYTEDKDVAGESSSTEMYNKITKLGSVGEKSFPILNASSDIQARNTTNIVEDTEINERTNIPPKGERSSSPFNSDTVDSRS